LLLSASIEFLHKHSDVDAALTQSWTDWWSRCSLPSSNLELDKTNYFLCHWQPSSFRLFQSYSAKSAVSGRESIRLIQSRGLRKQ
jgi:hypothetical protein